MTTVSTDYLISKSHSSLYPLDVGTVPVKIEAGNQDIVEIHPKNKLNILLDEIGW